MKVANIQAKALKAEAEKGSVSPALVHGLVDPKSLQFYCGKGFRTSSKGNPVNIPEPCAPRDSSGNARPGNGQQQRLIEFCLGKS